MKILFSYFSIIYSPPYDQQENNKPLRAYIKLMNRKLNGFGRYYKYGNVRKQFEAIDVEIRKIIRMRLKKDGINYSDNETLKRLGFRSLTDIESAIDKNAPLPKNATKRKTPMTMQPSQTGKLTDPSLIITHETHLHQLEKINRQLVQLNTLNRKLLQIAEELINN